MRKKLIKPWEKWSATKLDLLLFKCPLSFYFEYVENAKGKVKQNLPKIFGGAIHHMLEDFFKKNYKSWPKFLGAWKFYWFQYIVNQKYKLKIRTKTKESREEIKNYFATGVNILKKFWYQNLPYRDGELPRPEVEERFSRILKAHRIIGKIDRIQPVEGGVEIWDYKTGWKKPSEQELVRDVQFTFYNWAWRKKTGKNPIRMRLDHLFSGEQIIVPIRTEDDYVQLGRWLDEATVYVENILNPHPQRSWKDIAFRWLNPEDIERKYFSPRPSSFCGFCDYDELCQEYRPSDPIRERWLKIELERIAPDPGHVQLEFVFPRRKAKSLR